MPDTPCKLKRDNNEEKCSVAEFIAKMTQGTPPVLAWADPEPTAADLEGNTGRRTNFQPLVRGIPNWHDDIPLAEARLFWENAALHVITKDGGGCQWAKIEESKDGEEFMRSEIKVLTLRDRTRFGLDPETDFELSAVEYRQQGRLVAWRLTTGES